MAQSTRTSPGELAILGSGAVALVSSFLDFYRGPLSPTAWATGLFPLSALPVFCVVLMAAQVAMVRIAHNDVSSRPFGFTWHQIHVVLGFFATVVAACWLVLSRDVGQRLGIGFWGIAIASVVALVGAVAMGRERSGGLGY